VSLTVALAFQDPARTLTGDEVQSSVDAIVAALRARGWNIRGE
jgi:phenylalanyl-tRNA synthetase beta subunit